MWAVARDTGVRHALGTLDYTYYVSSGTYRLQNGSGVVDARIPPGVYDLLYTRGASTSSTGERSVSRVSASVPLPNGWQLLQACVAAP